jgi:hypothetical protein
LVLNGQPVSTDDGQEYRARLEHVFDELDEVLTRRNAVGVLEDAVGREVTAQVPHEGKHGRLGVLAPIADEDP